MNLEDLISPREEKKVMKDVEEVWFKEKTEVSKLLQTLQPERLQDN